MCADEPVSQAVLGPLTLNPCPGGLRQPSVLAAQIPGFILSPLRGLKSSSQQSPHSSSPNSGQQPGLAHHLRGLGPEASPLSGPCCHVAGPFLVAGIIAH